MHYPNGCLHFHSKEKKVDSLLITEVHKFVFFKNHHPVTKFANQVIHCPDSVFAVPKFAKDQWFVLP
jgi:hypothetical protein